jgi:hypothetical protein
MKKITLLMTALLWSSLFFGQTYLDEGFESATVPGLPAGWANVTVAGDAWTSTATSANSGSNSAHNVDNGDVEAWLISPSFDFTSSTNPELTYYDAVRFPDFAASIEVYYLLNYAGGTPAPPGGQLITNVFDFTSSDELVWKFRGAFDLSAINGQSDVRIAFKYKSVGLDSRWYVDDVLVREMPVCQEPTSGSISNITASSADFTFTPYPSQGETSWDVELVDITGGESQGGGTTTSESSTTVNFISLASSNNYEVYVRANCGGGDSAWSGPFAFSTLDSNDECSGANSITQEIEIATAASATAHSGTVNGATDSGIAENCGTGGDPDDDVWFSFVAQTDAVNINVDGSGIFDPVIEVFSTTDDTCGTLTYFGCADNNITPPSPPSEAYSGTGFEAGKTYYVRVFDYNTNATPNPNFTIKIWSSESLSEPELDKDVAEFRFYPNPVQDKLNLRAQDNIENVSVYNMLGQEVMRQAPNKNNAEVNMSSLQTGSYFVKVTINGITETKQIIKR